MAAWRFDSRLRLSFWRRAIIRGSSLDRDRTKARAAQASMDRWSVRSCRWDSAVFSDGFLRRFERSRIHLRMSRIFNTRDDFSNVSLTPLNYLDCPQK